MSAIEPGDFCRLARAHLDDWVPSGADHAAVAVLLSHFARSGPAEPLFLESLRALARDPNNGSLAAAARTIHDGWRIARSREFDLLRPLRLRADDRVAGAAGRRTAAAARRLDPERSGTAAQEPGHPEGRPKDDAAAAAPTAGADPTVRPVGPPSRAGRPR
jgi:hypothetical protein